jgi:uncharacterized protein (TIGR00255 family)
MRSMTGFGQATWQAQGRRIAIEIRSVNQRFLDVRFNLPREYQQWEAELRQDVMGGVERGKVDINVGRSGTAGGLPALEINEPLARASLKGWRQLQRALGLKGEIDVTFLLNRPEFVRVVESRPDTSADLPRLRTLLRAALKEFNRARDREGQALTADMRARTRELRRIHKSVEKRTVVLVPEMAQRLAVRVAALLAERPPDETRLLQEAALLAERADVTEELVRLASHLDRLDALVRQAGAVGKAIDFLLQEVHREINTIASKSADLEVTNLTLQARGEVEKLREQAQNVE